MRGYSGLYVHFPFCRTKCQYCDFYSKPHFTPTLIDDYIKALAIELKKRSAAFDSYDKWDTIYFGGGTPSLLETKQLEMFIKALGVVGSVKEFTIEANPEDINHVTLCNWEKLGINRVSIGAQSFIESDLQAIGRNHSSLESVRAIEVLTSHGMNFSVDLMYGLPGQTLESWEKNLSTLFAFNVPHFSAYILSYEPGTRLYHRQQKGDVKEADADLVMSMYDMLCDVAREKGYTHYEISNFAQQGKESIHNKGYWDGASYLGLGAGAHSYDGKTRGYNPTDLKGYIVSMRDGKIFYIEEPETESERLNDILITSLRTNEGLCLQNLEGFERKKIDEIKKRLVNLHQRGDLLLRDDFFVIPERKWIESDAYLREIILTED